MLFSELAQYFSTIESTSSRLEMTERLSELFAQSSPEEIDKVVYMLQGRVTPPYVKADFGLAEKMILRAAIRALNVSEDDFTKIVQTTGDIGAAIEIHKKKYSTPSKHMSVADVFIELMSITQASGEGSQEKKLHILSELIGELDPLSCRYVVRIPAQTLRLGFSDMTMLDALSWMLTGSKAQRKTIEEAYHVRPDLGYIAKVLKTGGIEGIAHVQPEVGTPVLMMRAQRLPAPSDIYEKLSTGIIEPKFDGFRLQVHVCRDSKNPFVRLFSRSLEDVTYMYPDIVDGVLEELDVQSAILEGEAIGFDEYAGTFLPFQETVQRKRKHNIAEKAQEIPLKMFLFELLYLNGTSLIKNTLEERGLLLRSILKTSGDVFKDTLLIVDEKRMHSVGDVESSFDEAIARGLEGIMVKKPGGMYEPGARGFNWIKYKRSYSAKIDDTIDCVVMGYDIGKGKRSGFGIGAFLVGVYDESRDTFATVAKIGTGLSDDEWRTLRQACEPLHADSKAALYDVDKAMNVDVWVKPHIVVEIKADEITRSSVHTAGRVVASSKNTGAIKVMTQGYALRFPRLSRFRHDKRPEDVTTVAEVAQMFSYQIKAT